MHALGARLRHNAGRRSHQQRVEAALARDEIGVRPHGLANLVERRYLRARGVPPAREEREGMGKRLDRDSRGRRAAAVDRWRRIHERLRDEGREAIEDAALHRVIRIGVAGERRPEETREKEHPGMLPRAVVADRGRGLSPRPERLRGRVIVGRMGPAAERRMEPNGADAVCADLIPHVLEGGRGRP